MGKIKRMLVMLFVLIGMLAFDCAAAMADDEPEYYFPVVYQMRGEKLELESATASMIVEDGDTIQHTSASVIVRNNTDQDIELVNATLLIAEKEEIDRLSRLTKQQYEMEMLRRRYKMGKWYRRVEHQGADSTPWIIKAGESDHVIFLIDESIYIVHTELESVACLFQVYAVPQE